jgi:hypothetical protein
MGRDLTGYSFLCPTFNDLQHRAAARRVRQQPT